MGPDLRTAPRPDPPRRPPAFRGGGARRRWIGLLACGGVLLGWAVQQAVPVGPDAAQVFAAPAWLPLAAVAVAGGAIMASERPGRPARLRAALCWTGLLLMIWVANGLPFDVLTAAGLIGHRTATGEITLAAVYWPGLTARASALVAVAVLATLALAHPQVRVSRRPATWYGYAAFVLALPYPLLRLHWALGGTIGLAAPGAAGEGWEPLLIAIPWTLAAVLSLVLVSPPHWVPRRWLLVAGWSAAAIVAMIGPAAIWSFVSAVASGGDAGTGDIALWVFGLFYASWFLWAIADAAATRSYQLRTAM